MKKSNRRYSGKYTQRKSGAGLVVTLLCVLLVLVAAVALVWKLNVFTLEMKVAGDREITLEYGDSYTELPCWQLVLFSSFSVECSSVTLCPQTEQVAVWVPSPLSL